MKLVRKVKYYYNNSVDSCNYDNVILLSLLKGANEEIAVNHYEPLVSSHNLIEVPGKVLLIFLYLWA